MVGEIRDMETAEIAIRASLTGHLVFSTLHTNDAPSAFTRLIAMGLEPFLLASAMEAVLAQRLVRTICPTCKAAITMERAHLLHIGFPEDEIATATFCKGSGCEACRMMGYLGRIGIYELLVMDESLRPLIMARATVSAIAQKAMSLGMHTLRDDGWKKVMAGRTTIEEVLRVTQADENFKTQENPSKSRVVLTGKASCIKPADPDDVAGACSWPGGQRNKQSSPPHCILVVDDDIVNRKLNMELLIQSGYETDAVADGAAGWKALQAKHYDLLITDNLMPGITGLELVKMLRHRDATLPIIMATGAIPKEELDRHPWIAISGFLIKPYRAAEMLRMVGMVLSEAESGIAPQFQATKASPLQSPLPVELARRSSCDQRSCPEPDTAQEPVRFVE
jgi:CheY-like chemotaxis protein